MADEEDDELDDDLDSIGNCVHCGLSADLEEHDLCPDCAARAREDGAFDHEDDEAGP